MSKTQHLSGGQGVAAGAEALPQQGKSRFAGAVAGVDLLHPQLLQRIGHTVHIPRGAVHVAVQPSEHMKAAYHGKDALVRELFQHTPLLPPEPGTAHGGSRRG